jgi:hypothetical protein
MLHQMDWSKNEYKTRSFTSFNKLPLQPRLLVCFLILLHKIPRYLRVWLHHRTILLRLCAACLAQCVPGCDALEYDSGPIRRKRIAPDQIRPRIPPCNLRVPRYQLIRCRQTLGLARLKRRVRSTDAHGLLRARRQVRRQHVVQIRERVSNSRHLPIQYTNHPRLGLVKHHIVYLIVAVHKAAAILRLRLWVAEKGYHVVLVRDLADRNAGVLVFGGGLRLGNGVERVDLTVVEAGRFAVAF